MKKQTKVKTWTCLGQNIWRNASTENLYQRIWVNGKRTWRVLNTKKLAEARQIVAVRLAGKLLAKEGLQRDPDLPPVFTTVGEALRNWSVCGCPGKNQKPRKDESLSRAQRLTERMLEFWDTYEIANVRPKLINDYADWRRKTSAATQYGQRMKSGNCLEKEMFALYHSFELARRQERLTANPCSTFARIELVNDTEVSHCRDHRPKDADELHKVALRLFDHPRSEALGWQFLIEAMTGARTSEILDCRMDANAPGQPGFIDGEVLHLKRRKQGVNPFVIIHPALAQCLKAFFKWHQYRFPASPWWFPSSHNFDGKNTNNAWPRPARNGSRPVNKCALNTALYHKVEKWLGAGRKITSHSLRAYYVTARRSEGIEDVRIAAEIGDKTGAAIICSTYGDLPPNWTSTTVGKIGWLPLSGKPAWYVFDRMTSKIVTLGSARLAAQAPADQTPEITTPALAEVG